MTTTNIAPTNQAPHNPTGTTAIGNISDLEKELLKAAGPSFMMGMRIVQSVSDAFKDRSADLGDYVLGKLNLKNKVKCLVGPRRWTAMRLKDGNLDMIDHNLTPNSKYNAVTNDWDFPDGFTPGFREIKDRKIPDNGQKLVNLVGYEYLLYLLDHKVFCTFYCAKTALTMTQTDAIVKANKGKVVIFGSEEVGKSNRWWVPNVKVSIDPAPAWPDDDDAKEALEKFLSPGVMFDPSSNQTSTRAR